MKSTNQAGNFPFPCSYPDWCLSWKKGKKSLQKQMQKQHHWHHWLTEGGFPPLQDAQTGTMEVKLFSFCLAPDSEDHARLPGCALPWWQLAQFATFLRFVSISSRDADVLLQDDSLCLLVFLLLLLLLQSRLCHTCHTTSPTLIKGLIIIIFLTLVIIKMYVKRTRDKTAEGDGRRDARTLGWTTRTEPGWKHTSNSHWAVCCV